MVLLKKAQTEIIGLVIIIIILTFALIFGLKFLIKDENNELNERYLQLNADNLRSVILKTNFNECNIKDEIINCNQFNDAVCFKDCNDLEKNIKDIIESSIKNNYEFSAEKIEIKKGDCLNKDIETSSIQPLALTEIKVNLKVC